MAAKTDEPLSIYVRQFEEAERSSIGGRKESEKARDYFDGRQIDATQEAALKKRKQPITPENLIRPKLEALCGLERQGRVDPIAYPRVPSKEDDANAATDALRYVEQDQDFDIKKSRVFQSMLIEGFGGVEITVRKLKNGVVDPFIAFIAWDRLYYDPHSSEADFSDVNYDGYVTWMDLSDALTRTKDGGPWAGKQDIINSTVQRGTSSLSDTFDDKPKLSAWYDSKRQRIRVNTHYHKVDGVWHRCVFTLAGELEESAPSPFLDDEGNSENPLILQSAYVDRDNDRYGIVRDMIPLQDEVNKRRSKFLHMVNSNRWRLARTLGQDKRTAKEELAKPDAVMIADDGEIESLDIANKDSGQFTLLQDTRQTLKGNVGPNGYLQGKEGQSQSGRAVLAQQQAGMTEMTPLLDNLRHFTLRSYRQIWNRIRQYWTAERWIRVTDDEKNARFVGLNVTKGRLAMQKLADATKNGQIDPQTAQQYAMQIQSDPSMAEPANAVGELDVDIDIDEVNETPTLQIEQFEQLTQLASSGMLGQPVPPPIVELIIQASNLRDKQKLLEIIDKMGQQPPDPMQQQAAQIQMQGMAAKVAVDQTKAEKTQAETAQIAQDIHMQPVIEGLRAGAAQQPQLPPAA